MNYNIFKSRTFWIAVLLVLYNALVQIPSTAQNLVYLNYAINAVGGLLITYFHVNPSQNYNGPSDTKGNTTP